MCTRPTKSPLANEALQRIAALYAIEATIRGQPADARLAVRPEQSAPLFAELRAWLDKTLRASRARAIWPVPSAMRCRAGRH